VTTVTTSMTSGNNLSQYSKIDESDNSPFSSCPIIVRSLVQRLSEDCSLSQMSPMSLSIIILFI